MSSTAAFISSMSPPRAGGMIFIEMRPPSARYETLSMAASMLSRPLSRGSGVVDQAFRGVIEWVMHKYLIEADLPSGRIKASGKKNAALPCIAATVLAGAPVILRNVPEIEDVQVMLEVLRQLGASVEGLGATPGGSIRSRPPSDASEQARKVRASILFAGPRSRFREVLVAAARRRRHRPPPNRYSRPRPRGARGARRHRRSHPLRGDKLVGADIFLDEASVTGTENVVMAAVLAEGHTTIRNAGQRASRPGPLPPPRRDGRAIAGIGSNVLGIEGVRALGGADFSIGPDDMEIGSFIGLDGGHPRRARDRGRRARGPPASQGRLRPSRVSAGRSRRSSCSRPRASPCALSPIWAARYPRSTIRPGRHLPRSHLDNDGRLHADRGYRPYPREDVRVSACSGSTSSSGMGAKDRPLRSAPRRRIEAIATAGAIP